MAYNQKNQNTNKEDDFVIYQLQGQKSFLKFKMDWANIGKLHLSFVAHTGRQNGCKQTDFIEAALDVEGGSGAIYLAEAVLNGMMGQKRIQAIKKAKETQAKYPEELFVYNGGSPARNDRPVMWRQISLIPGTKSAYVFQAVEAEGIQNQMGGYQKKPDAEVKRILVSCSKEDLIGLAGAFKMHWTAYLSNAERYTQHMTNHREAPAAASDAPVQAPAPAVTQAPPAPVQNVNIPDTAYTIYDSIGNWMRVAGTPERALEMLRNAITTMKTKDGYVRRDNKEYGMYKVPWPIAQYSVLLLSLVRLMVLAAIACLSLFNVLSVSGKVAESQNTILVSKPNLNRNI